MKNEGKGILFALGSWQIFTDKFFDKENNRKILDFVINHFNAEIDHFKNEKNREIEKQNFVPNIEKMANQLKNSV